MTCKLRSVERERNAARAQIECLREDVRRQRAARNSAVFANDRVAAERTAANARADAAEALAAALRSDLDDARRGARSYTTPVHVWADEACMALTACGWRVVRTYSGRDYCTVEIRVGRCSEAHAYWQLRVQAPSWAVLADRIAGSLAESGRRAQITRREDSSDLDSLIAVIREPHD